MINHHCHFTLYDIYVDNGKDKYYKEYKELPFQMISMNPTPTPLTRMTTKTGKDGCCTIKKYKEFLNPPKPKENIGQRNMSVSCWRANIGKKTKNIIPILEYGEIEWINPRHDIRARLLGVKVGMVVNVKVDGKVDGSARYALAITAATAATL